MLTGLHRVVLTRDDVADDLKPVFLWAETNVGKRFSSWNWIWAGSDCAFYFQHEEDKIKFILKWL